LTVETFAVSVPGREVDELRSRLGRTRWPQRLPTPAWAAGSDLDTVRRLVGYWSSGYDWREHESAMNHLPHRVVELAGKRVHFLHFQGEHDGALPIVVTHGWPGSFLEQVGLAWRLAHPTRYGRPVDQAFDVIVPSLPGFAFSEQRGPVCHDLPTHELWHRLMRHELGYHRYGAHGGDLGAGVTTRLAAAYPDELVGIYILAVTQPDAVDEASLTEEEQQYLRQVADWDAEEGAYGQLQATRPISLSYGLSDSPTGLLAWLVEKYRAWSDCGGNISTRFSDDDILTQVSLYWYTNTIATSFRPYLEYRLCPQRVTGRIHVPTAVAVLSGDLSRPPRSWAERTYPVAR
jgi:pimeloyl-ACP methyl ester carboxylesterase